MSPEPTPSQTIGPFYEFSLLDRDLSRVVEPDHPGAVRIEGAVYDGAGEPVDDAMLELWQADESGRYPEPGEDGAPRAGAFPGFARCGTDDAGNFAFVTVKPGRVPGPDGTSQAPHVCVSVFARGLLRRLVTRIYFPDEAEANAEDRVLNLIEDPEARSTLVAREVGSGALRFDVRLQDVRSQDVRSQDDGRGGRQTVFFEV